MGTLFSERKKKRMANTKISRCEQETIICFNQADKTACISTFKSNWITKLKTFAEDYPDLVTLNREDPYGCYTFTVPKKCISLRSPKKREISEEQKQAMSERAKTMFSKNSSIDKINKKLKTYNIWNDKAIIDRQLLLYNLAKDVWNITKYEKTD